MSELYKGARVRAERSGYVGVGNVLAPAVGINEFAVEIDGESVPILTAPLEATTMGDFADDPENCEYLPRIQWLDTPSRDGLKNGDESEWHRPDSCATVRIDRPVSAIIG